MRLIFLFFLLFLNQEIFAQQEKVVFIAPEQTVEPGDWFEYVIEYDLPETFPAITAFQFTLIFDSDVLFFRGIKSNTFETERWLVSSFAEAEQNGYANIAAAGTKGLRTGRRALFAVLFAAKEVEDSTVVAFSNTQVNELTGASTSLEGMVTVQTKLPISTGTFTAVADGTDVFISFQTYSEINVSHYDIEASYDGDVYFSVGTLPATGSHNGTVEYRFTAHDLDPGDYWFRISEVRFDGTRTYTSSNFVRLDRYLLSVDLYPNPSHGYAKLEIYSPEDDNGTIIVSDPLGRTVYYDRVRLRRNERKVIPLDMTDIASGTYIIHIVTSKNSIIRILSVVK